MVNTINGSIACRGHADRRFNSKGLEIDSRLLNRFFKSRCAVAVSLCSLFWIALNPVLAVQGARASQQDLEQAQSLYHEGKYSDVISQCESAISNRFVVDEDWFLLKVNSEFAIGRYANARKSLDLGLEAYPDSIRLRWLGASVYKFDDDLKRSLESINEIGSQWRSSSWQYRDVASLLVIGRQLLESGGDPKRVLDDIYLELQRQHPAQPEIYAAIAQLALDKNDYDLAAKNYAKAVDLDATNPDYFFGLARAYRPSHPDKAKEALDRSLKINPNHVDSLLMIAEQQLSSEDYDAAEANLQEISNVNPECPQAWAFRAVLAHLNNDPTAEGNCRKRALKHWRGNPEVDYLIGRELSQKYRFLEGSIYQRRALLYDPDYQNAKIQLAHDLLRLGQELEGWKLAEEVFDADQYNVVANNLVALRDNLSEFTTVERNGFVVRMDRLEAEVYSDLVLDLLDEASKKLTAKYVVDLQKPVFIEIFPRQQDFAIRTFGLPGGAGFLGVCFGRVVTMNSPAAQGASRTNWRSVLWHEFCHVVTLQKTKNKMPRWLSEGISVYEERLANPAWGDAINPRYREMILGDDLTPVSHLSGAFLNPKSPEHLQFAYFESSLVVHYLVEEFGEPALVKVLDELSIGTPINDALRRHTAPTEFLDKKFKAYATNIANNLAVDADWTKPADLISDSAGWAKWLSEHPDNIYGLLGQAKSLLAEQDYRQVLQVLDRFDELYPETKGAEQAFAMRAVAWRKLDNTDEETKSLEKVLQLDADDANACVRLLEIYTSAGSWDNVTRVSQLLQGINPMLKLSQQAMATAAENTGDDLLAIRSLTALAALNPLDKADTYYRLAAAEFRQQQLPQAKRNVLRALDAAPRYRDAHQLLLKVIEASEKQRAEPSSRPDSDSSPATDESKK